MTLPCVERLAAALLAAAALLLIGGGARAAAAEAEAATTTTTPTTPTAVPALDEREALRLGDAAIGRAVPELALRDRQGQLVNLSRYRGKPLLVSFIYTGCFQICPTQTRALYEAVKGLDRMLGEQQFNVVSIGFNQPFDTPDAMRAFAAQNRIGYRNWEFLSPTREQVEPLTRAFGFSYVATPAGFDHVLGVTVVDAQGRIHAQVYGDRLRADRLGEPLRQLLLAAPPQAAPVTLASMVERVRILCTIYDPDSGEYRYDVKLILEIIGGAGFFLTVIVYGLLEWRSQRRARRSTCQPPQPASGSAA
ncbi:MAG: SCO family protein [Proteobacteria bacterium]|nr:SCO family protein [Pseudomonadota bacterium]